MLVLRRSGAPFATPLRVAFDAGMRGFFRKAIPGMIANSFPQLIMVVGAIVASGMPSVVSWLYFANRLIELPLGIVGTAMGTVLVPELTHAVRSGDPARMKRSESLGFELAIGLALPATLGLMVLSHPIVQLLFEHGAFDAADTASTAQALRWLALGLPAHVGVKALAPAFFARDDTMTPLRATLGGLGVAVVAAWLLGQAFGAGGIAAAIALAAWTNATILFAGSVAAFGFAGDAVARRRLSRIVLAALAMAAVLWPATQAAQALAAAHGVARAAILGVLIAAALATYMSSLMLFGVVRRTEMARAIGQFRGRRLRG
jgi:putative peptidoglycan lipid II flippase